MVTIIKRKTSKKELNKIIEKIKSKSNLLDTSKYSGKVDIKDSPVEIQKKLRNEWE